MKKYLLSAALFILSLTMVLTGCQNNTSNATTKGNATTATPTTAKQNDNTTKAPEATTLSPQTTTQKADDITFELDQTEIEMGIGDTAIIQSTVIGSMDEIVWESSDETIAEVIDGIVIANGLGTATITAKLGNITRTVTINVNATIKLKLKEDAFTINLGQWTDPTSGKVHGVTEYQIEADLYVDGEKVDTTFTYEVQNQKLIKVSESGLVTAKDNGNTTIKVKTTYQGQDFEETIKVRVSKIYIESDVKFSFGGNKDEWTIDVSKFGFDKDDVLSILTPQGDNYCEVDQYEYPLFNEKGEAKVITEGVDIESKTEPDKVIIETEYVMVEVTVAYVLQNNVTFVSEVSPMIIGGSKKLYLYCWGVKVTEDAVWTSNKPMIADVSEDGTITAKNYGTAVISATVYGYTYTTTQVVYKEGEITSTNGFSHQVGYSWDDAGNVTAAKHGYTIPTHGKYVVGDWVSFSFTLDSDMAQGDIYVYYGINNGTEGYIDGKVTYAVITSRTAGAGVYDDSSFILLDEEGNQVGSIDNNEGYDVLKGGKRYTLFMKIMDDGSVDHDLFIKFSSNEVIPAEAQVKTGVIFWRDSMNDISQMVTVNKAMSYAYNGETRNTIKIDGTYTFDVTTLSTQNKLDIASMGITDKVLAARIEGTKYDIFKLNSDGSVNVSKGCLTIKEDIYTYMGTSGVKTLLIETEDNNYLVQFEIKAESNKFDESVVLNSGDADYIITKGTDMIDLIESGKGYVKFNFYAYKNFSASGYIYLQIGARHVWVTSSATIIHSATWDSSRHNYVTDDFLEIYDENGNLVRNTVSANWFGIGQKNYGSTSGNLEAGKWYTIVINTDGRAWDNNTCKNVYPEYSHLMLKCVDLSGYINSPYYFGMEEVNGITLLERSLDLSKGKTKQLNATISSQAINKTISWTSSDTTVATVDEFGVVTAIGYGKCIITAENNGNKAECVINVPMIVEISEETKKDTGVSLTSWLPGTFDKEDADWNYNVAPTYVTGDEYVNATTMSIDMTIKEGVDSDKLYLNIYELSTTETNTWTQTSMTNRATVIGPDSYIGAYFNGYQYKTAGADVLSILDLTDKTLYSLEAIKFIPGHTYRITYKLEKGTSLMFNFTTSSTIYYGGGVCGFYNCWDDTAYCLGADSVATFSTVSIGYANNDVKSIALSSEKTTVRAGETLQVNATLTNYIDKTIEWTTSDSTVATVDENGLVKAISQGTVKIYATAKDGQKAEIELTIREAISDKVDVTYIVNGTVYKALEAKVGEKIENIEAPEILSYTFKGWTSEGNLYDFSIAASKDLTLTATYEKSEDFGDKNGYNSGKTTKYLSGAELMAAIKDGKNYAVFEITLYSELNASDTVYFEVGARHFVIESSRTNVFCISNGWDTNKDTITDDFVCIYKDKALYNDAIYMPLYGYVGNSKTGTLEKGTTYTVIVNLNGRSWSDAVMGTEYNGGTYADLDTAGLIARATNGAFASVVFKGLSE